MAKESNTTPRLEYDRGSLLLHWPGDPALPPAAGALLTWDGRVGAFRALGHHYRALVRALTHAGQPFRDLARDYPDLAGDVTTLPPLYPHQGEAFAAWNKGRRGVVELPTGSGKTRLALEVMAAVGRAVLVLVPTLDLMAQWARVTEGVFPGTPGMLGGGSHALAPLTISTYASAYRHGGHIGNRFCLAVFDECHHLAGERYLAIAEMLIAPYRLGLSATVERPDERHHLLYQMIGPPVYSRAITELSGSYLADYRVETLRAELTDEELAAYREARGEYRAFVERLGQALDGPGAWQRFVFSASRTPEGRAALDAYYRQRRIAFSARRKFEILEMLFHRHRGERVLVFTHDNATAHAVSRRYLVPVITHQTRVAERKTILARFSDGTWPFVVTSRVLNEGVDVPMANVAVILSGSASVREHVQRLGRILRRAPGKEAVLYEVLSSLTGEEFVSQRRREHDAYR